MKDSRELFERLAAQLGEGPPPTDPAAPRAFREEYWNSFRDLLTRDVTTRGFRELVEHDAQETLRFFLRDVRVADLASRPWYEKWPASVWRGFVAIAHRLGPWRRVFFTLAALLLLLGWFRYAAGLLMAPVVPPFHSWEDLMVLTATVLAFLLVLELRDKLGLKGDLEVARQIQFGLLPFGPIDKIGCHVETRMRPANTVGGDYFDLLDLGPDRVAFIVGDVAGKGMPAALLMALLQGSLKTLVTAGLTGAELVRKLNSHLAANIPSNRLVTLFLGELDLATGAIEYVNGGHNPPLLIRTNGSIETLEPTGMALGVLSDTTFETGRTQLGPGDRILLYTDGVTEAENSGDQEYGEARLRGFLEEHRAVSDAALVDGILGNVLLHCGSVRPRDDMTLMALSRPSLA